MITATLQQVRRGYEASVEEALDQFAIPLYTANQYTDDVANLDEFCYAELIFRQMLEITLTDNVEYLRGSLIVDLFTRKGEGPGRSQDVIQEVMRGLCRLGKSSDFRITSMDGPIWASLTNKPHTRTRLICGVYARPVAAESVVPEWSLLVTDQGDALVTDQAARIWVVT